MVDAAVKIKQQIFKNDDEIKSFLQRCIKKILNSKIKENSISPLILTYKEFIDTNLKKILDIVTSELKKKANFDEQLLKIVAAYIIREDIKNENKIYKTIASYIIDLIKTNHVALSKFSSEMREVYSTPQGKFIYPVLYPYDRHKYASPIPLLKQILTKTQTIKKQLQLLEEEYKKIKKEYEINSILLSDIKTATNRIKNSIVPTLKKIHNSKEYEKRLLIFSLQKKRFEVLYLEADTKVKQFEKKLKALENNIAGFKEKHKNELNKEEELIEIIAKNLSTPKRKIK